MKLIRIVTMVLTILAVTLTGVGNFSAAEATQTSWQEVQGVSTRSMQAVVYGNGRFVQVGNDGRVLISDDGRSWTFIQSPTTSELEFVFWMGNQFLAIGSEGCIITSPDGKEWTLHPRYAGPKTSFRAVAWNGNMFVAMSNVRGAIYTSPDGITWTYQSKLFDESNRYFTHMIWDGHRFVALSPEYSGVYIYTSDSGTDWVRTPVNSGSKLLDACGIAFNGKTYVITGQSETRVLTSTDLKTFKSVKIPGYSLRKVKFVGGRFIATGNNHKVTPNTKWSRGNILTSVDGSKWTRIANTTLNETTDVAYDGKTYVVTTASMKLFGEEGFGATLVSSDALHWKEIVNGTADEFTSLATNGNVLIAANQSGFVQRSLDGEHWKRVNAGGAPVSKVLWDGKRFVMSGSDIYTSPDGLKWSLQKCTFDTSQISARSKSMVLNKGLQGFRISDMHFNGSLYVAVGEWGSIMTSKDLKHWTFRKSNTLIWIDKIAYDGKTYIANTNDQGTKILRSTDGVNWKMIDLSSNKCFSTSVSSNGNGFVMIGTDSVGEITAKGTFVDQYRYKSFIFTSQDGIKWEKTDMNHYDHYHALGYSGKEYLISSSAKILRSMDGKVWEDVSPEIYATNMPDDFLRFKGSLFACGINGSILKMTESQ